MVTQMKTVYNEYFRFTDDDAYILRIFINSLLYVTYVLIRKEKKVGMLYKLVKHDLFVYINDELTNINNISDIKNKVITCKKMGLCFWKR